MRRWLPLAVAVLVVATACEPDDEASADRRHHVVVDTDLAFDDIMALMYLLQREDVVVDALTLAGTGEAHCDPGVSNAKRLLALAGSLGTPVACGRETPLDGENAFPDEWRAAVDDLSMLALPQVDTAEDPRGAVRLLLESLDGDATLITLGPLTNVAEALREDPGLAERVPRVVAMAGAVDVAGNAPGGAAEYNVWVDPLAARDVLERMDVALVPLDATSTVPFNTYAAEALEANLTTPEAEVVGAILDANRDYMLSGQYFFWDPLAAVLAFEEGLAEWEDVQVSVTASAGGTAGWIDRADGGIATRMAATVGDAVRFEEEFLSTLAGRRVTTDRPDPTLTVTFDGERCAVSPTEVAAGPNDVVFVNERDLVAEAALVAFSDRRAPSYDEIVRLLGEPGSPLPTKGRITDVEPFAFVPGLTPVEIPPGPFAAACVLQRDADARPRVWLGPLLSAA